METETQQQIQRPQQQHQPDQKEDAEDDAISYYISLSYDGYQLLFTRDSKEGKAMMFLPMNYPIIQPFSENTVFVLKVEFSFPVLPHTVFSFAVIFGSIHRALCRRCREKEHMLSISIQYDEQILAWSALIPFHSRGFKACIELVRLLRP